MLQKIKYILYKLLFKLKIIHPKVVVMMDGGICSQMHQYLLGQLYCQRGFRVCYDLLYYRDIGYDLNREFVRNFDLLKAFPFLDFKEASLLEINFYKRKFYNEGIKDGVQAIDYTYLTQKPPLYLGGYYHAPAESWLNAFLSKFRFEIDVLDSVNKELYSEIGLRFCSVAVHVRRGDLREEAFYYGKPASLEYFKRAVAFFVEKYSKVYFYFFSDEPGWVEDALIPYLRIADNFTVVNVNGSEKGYMDLFLISQCQHQITSKGTLGKYGALLNDNSKKYVILCDDKIEYTWKELFFNPIYL